MTRVELSGGLLAEVAEVTVRGLFFSMEFK